MADKKTVWILGAGFSRPLGGPLRADLFTPESMQLVIDKYPELEHDAAVQWAHQFYRKHLPNGSSKNGKWTNAEQFLDALESMVDNASSPARCLPLRRHVIGYVTGELDAARNHVVAANSEFPSVEMFSRLSTLTRSLIPHDTFDRVVDRNQLSHAGLEACLQKIPELFVAVLHGARRLLAAECSIFHEPGDVVSEKWKPYVNWVGALSRNDTIISFNYDRVVEVAGKHFGNGRICVVKPDRIHQAESQLTRLFKLHGSVDWKINSSGEYETLEEPCAHWLESNELVLGTPGRSKGLAVERLKRLWNEAKKSLIDADEIIILGYSLPQTDAASREFLRESIRANPKSTLKIRIVLGSRKSETSARLQRLLTLYTGRNVKQNQIIVEPLGAEDAIDYVSGIRKSAFKPT